MTAPASDSRAFALETGVSNALALGRGWLPFARKRTARVLPAPAPAPAPASASASTSQSSRPLTLEVQANPADDAFLRRLRESGL